MVYHDGAFYTCIVARVASDTDDPAVDTDSWAVEVSESGGLDAAIQNAIDAQGAIQFGSDYKGAWEAGIFAVGDDVYHDGVFYECDVARAASDTDDPATDTGSWSVKTVETSDASSAVQVAINAQARIEYGDSYKGTWAAGVFAVGDVAYHDGVFYECDAARAASDTDDPAADTTGWSPKASSEGGITRAVQNAIDAQAVINFGSDYKGVWAAGAFAAGNVVYHGGFFYECDVARSSSNTDDPATDTASWSPKVSIESDIAAVKIEVDQARIDIEGVDTKVDEARTDIGDVDTKVDQAISDISNLGVSQAVQNAINAQATASYGDSYKGVWAAGAYAVGNVVYHSGAFYTCDTARTASNTDDPATDTASWSIKVAEVGGLTQAVQNAIDAQAAINFGDDYKGAWAVGAFAVGDVVYFDGVFYICTQTRTTSNTSNPFLNASAWDVKTVTFEVGDVTVDLSEISAAVQNAINAQGTAAYGENYRGTWEVGIFVPGNVVYFDGAFYTCEGVRTAGHTDDPASDTDVPSWAIEVAGAGAITLAVQNAIDAYGAINFGEAYKGKWKIGSFAVDDVVYHDGQFYICTQTRTFQNSNNPVLNESAWDVKTVDADVTVDLSSVTTAVQDAINAQATASYGANYQGTWAAGAFAVGNVVYHSGAFYTCDVARTASNTDDPATDTASWSIKVAEVGGLSQAVQNAIDAQAAINFGEDYKGTWAVGAYAVGDVVYFDGSFYECDVARNVGHTTNPSVNTSAWSVKTVTFEIGGDVTVDLSEISAAVQNAINAQATASYGDSYKGVWAAGAYAVGNVVYHDGAFYTCDTARAASNTDDPATDTASWSIKVAEVGGLTQAVQNAIDAQGAINFGDDYKGAWAVGAFSVDDVVHHDGQFYVCTQNRTANNINNPAVNTPAWDVKTVEVANVDISALSADVQNAINAQATSVFGDKYKGVWAAGIFAVGNVVYHDGAFYTCDTARTASNTDDPATDTASWSIKVAEVGGLTQAVQNAIDAQAAINFGDDYKGAWAVGAFAVGDVVYFDGVFYECDVTRTTCRAHEQPVSSTRGPGRLRPSHLRSVGM